MIEMHTKMDADSSVNVHFLELYVEFTLCIPHVVDFGY